MTAFAPVRAPKARRARQIKTMLPIARNCYIVLRTIAFSRKDSL